MNTDVNAPVIIVDEIEVIKNDFDRAEGTTDSFTEVIDLCCESEEYVENVDLEICNMDIDCGYIYETPQYEEVGACSEHTVPNILNMEKKISKNGINKMEENAASMCKKQLAPEEIWRGVTVVMDERHELRDQMPSVLQGTLSEKQKNLRQACDPAFFALMPMVSDNVIGFLQRSDDKTRSQLDEEVLLTFTPLKFIQLVNNTVNESPIDFEEIGSKSLIHFVDVIKERFLPLQVRITVVVLHLQSYFQELRRYEDCNLKQRLQNRAEILSVKKYPLLGSCRTLISRKQVTLAGIRLQMERQVNIHELNDIAELAALVISFSKAVSEREQRRRLASVHNFPFLPEGELAGRGVKLDDRNGKGCGELWRRLLQQCFGRCFPEGAEAIARKYPTPQHLLRAYDKLNTDEERMKLLANLVVRTKYDFDRRLGEAYSKKVFLAFTCLDPKRGFVMNIFFIKLLPKKLPNVDKRYTICKSEILPLYCLRLNDFGKYCSFVYIMWRAAVADLFHGFQVGASSLCGVVFRRNSCDAALFLPAFRYSPYRMRNVH
ncbi:Crossover junction endonuclease EME1 [Trichinella patagoniensis]|uniref:Crossover junction endonuclease EME1 n=1 Tax=Trichinella patagoniensis TaxID=990121 RepID=A0A0V0Z3V9_9BILA|nr:Crossover junction endonuclease EME1 [Trichinella patagoniensis]